MTTEGLFSAVELGQLDRVGHGAGVRPGYRLHRLELYNWGTFDRRIEVLRLDGDNTLVTGDIGSGKSTLVDALTTLLLPAQRINYNKAAGADTRERTLRTYVLGHYKSERVESTGASRPVGLRDQRSYSVLLGVFRNEGHDAVVTLAQVFWMPGTTEQQPRRFYVVADDDCSIERDFTDFGTDPADLKRRFRSRGASVFDHYPEYGTKLRRMLGIRSEQALDLFHQTISMKSVGNLTEFVRQHMLEPADPTTRIASLVQHFDDLSRAHDAVRKARDQLEQLQPITSACDEYDVRSAAIDTTTTARDAVPVWLAEHQLRLLDVEQQRVTADHADAEAHAARVDGRLRELADEQAGLRLAREGVGGGRLAVIDVELRAEAERRQDRRVKAGAYATLLESAGLDQVEDVAGFARNRELTMKRYEDGEQLRSEDAQRLADLTVQHRDAEQDSRKINSELLSLRGRDGNIDTHNLALRDRLATELGVAASVLPFVGELIQVRDERADWRGAAERVLHGFALSVLVPTELYDQVAAWADRHHLRARFVYFRVGGAESRRSTALPDERTLAAVIDVRPGRHAEWLAAELAMRADHVRVDDVQELRQHRRALTRQGQVKTDRRHEKDDRFAIDDRTRWVLGWSNEDKIDALVAAALEVDRRLGTAKAALETERRAQADRATSSGTLTKLLAFTEWAELDWRAPALRIGELEAERTRLQQGNAELATIEQRLAELAAQVARAEGEARDLGRRLGALEQRLRDLGAEQDSAEARLAAVRGGELERLRGAYGQIEGLHAPPTTLAECRLLADELRRALDEELDRHHRAQRAAGERAGRLIGDFRRAWPGETTELGADVQAGDEYRALRDRIASDDLPRFEAEFKRQLNTNTINDVAGFQAWLDQSAQTIRSRIATINDSLGAIDYNAGTRITLLTEPTTNQEVRTFREELRACTDDALSLDDQYSEERFRRVKAIIERFRGREGATDLDRRWTAIVTDVRNWYVFAASEQDVESGAEREHYTDSDGKSGGQKEKLAYTILAASLAYQFGLEWGVPKSRDFRFTVIDEAFGRGSDGSTRYALELFAKLGLQLLVVTPLQKVHVIEPYVSAVGFVENRTSQRSRLQSLTIEEYHAARRRHERVGPVDEATPQGDE